MRYQDLAIEIRPLPGGTYETWLRSSTDDSGREPFVIPGSVLPLEEVFPRLERQVVRGGLGPAATRELTLEEDGQEAGGRAELDLRRLGEDLFTAVFQRGTARVLHSCLGAIEGAGGEGAGSDEAASGLRLRVTFDLSDADLTELAALPWELLHHPERREYFTRIRRTPVVRSLRVPGPARPLSVRGDLRVLLVEAAPEDQTRLDTPVEVSGVRAALERLPRVDVRHLEGADLSRLSEELTWGDYHVLHFMGHGAFDADTGEAVLFFEDEDHRTVRVPALYLAEHLKQSSTVRLVVLNACRTGTLRRQRGLDPYTAAAAALSFAGIPAVVAMQFPISDPAAIAFAGGFYKALVEGDPVEAAVVHGRRAICDEAVRLGRETFEWVTPVLYLRGSDGRILELETAGEGMSTASTAAPVAPAPAEGPVRSPLRLGIRSMEPHGAELELEADRVLNLVRYFDGRHIRDEALWHGTVLPEIEEFLREGLASHRPLIVDLAAHQSLAFAVGSFLESKSGVEISVVQRGQGRPIDWPAEPGEVPEGPLWQDPESVPRKAGAQDLAVAVSATWDVLDDVRVYLDREEIEVSRILHVSIAPEPSRTSVLGGPHALRLAQTLGRILRGRPVEERMGSLHLFASAPNALLLFLGQLAPALGRVQLYEYDFEKRKVGAYWPSFRLPAG